LLACRQVFSPGGRGTSCISLNNQRIGGVSNNLWKSAVAGSDTEHNLNLEAQTLATAAFYDRTGYNAVK